MCYKVLLCRCRQAGCAGLKVHLQHRNLPNAPQKPYSPLYHAGTKRTVLTMGIGRFNCFFLAFLSLSLSLLAPRNCSILCAEKRTLWRPYPLQREDNMWRIHHIDLQSRKYYIWKVTWLDTFSRMTHAHRNTTSIQGLNVR